MLASSTFSFSHNVFKKLLSEGRKQLELSCIELEIKIEAYMYNGPVLLHWLEVLGLVYLKKSCFTKDPNFLNESSKSSPSELQGEIWLTLFQTSPGFYVSAVQVF